MIRILFVVTSRLLGVAYIVLAVFAFPDVRQLLRTEYKLDGGTYYIPLSICEPGAVNVDSSVVTFDLNDVDGCRTLDLLVNASAVSLVLSSAAVLIYMLIDLMVRCNVGPFNRSSVSGMGIFLVFIMMQAATAIWSLAAECRYWSQYTMDIWVQLGWDELYNIDTIQTYGNNMLLWSTGASGLVFCFFVFIEAMINIFCGRGSKDDDDTDDVDPTFSAGQDEIAKEDTASSLSMRGSSMSTGPSPSWTAPTV